MKLIYQGTLSPQVTEWVIGMLKQYPCVVEIDPINYKEFWKQFLEWAEYNLPKHTITIESGSSGEHYNTDRVLYGTVGKGDGTNDTFMFFKTKAERDLFVNRFGQLVSKIEPFYTVLEA